MQQFIMGLDVGYGNTKAVYSTESGVEHNLVLPSVAHEILDLQRPRRWTRWSSGCPSMPSPA